MTVCSLTHIFLKRFCIFLKSNVLYNKLGNNDSKQSKINEAAVKVTFIVKKKTSNGLYNKAEIYFYFIFQYCTPGCKRGCVVPTHQAFPSSPSLKLDFLIKH